MPFDPKHLAALAAVLRLGSFERAAEALGLTQSAISQRVKALEEQVGQVLVLRETPARGTDAGRKLANHAASLSLLEAQLAKSLQSMGPESGAPVLRLACNADSADSWLIPALAQVPDTCFDLTIDDQEHSLDWLKSGEVSAALSASKAPVHGCDVLPLGQMRYVAACAPACFDSWFANGLTAEAFAHAPMLRFDLKDTLQARFLKARFAQRLRPPTHLIPTTAAFNSALRHGLGWGLVPEPMIAADLTSGRLIALAAETALHVPLYLHFNRMLAAPLAPLVRALKAAARESLHPL